MSCERWRDALLRWALGGPAEPELEGHLRACPDCRRSLQDQRLACGRIDEELGRALAVAPGSGLLPRVRERLERERERGRPPRLGWLAPLAAVLSVVATGVVWRTRTAVTPPTAPLALGKPAPTPPAVVVSAVPPPAVTAAAREPRVREGRHPPEPEVLLAAAQEDLLRRFVAGLRNPGVDASAIAVDGAGRAALSILPLANLPPLAVLPLTPTDSEGVDHE
jgi:hypothetical protein